MKGKRYLFNDAEREEQNIQKNASSLKGISNKEMDALSLPPRSTVHTKKNYPVIPLLMITFVLLIAIFLTLPSWGRLIGGFPVDYNQPSINPAVEVVEKVRSD